MSTITMGDDRLLRVEAVAALLACSVRNVWRLRSTGVLPSVSIGRSTRFKASDVARIVREGVR